MLLEAVHAEARLLALGAAGEALGDADKYTERLAVRRLAVEGVLRALVAERQREVPVLGLVGPQLEGRLARRVEDALVLGHGEDGARAAVERVGEVDGAGERRQRGDGEQCYAG